MNNENKTNEQNLVLTKLKENNFRGTWIATTGCGKTRVGVIIAGEFIRRNNSENSLVITPTENLRDNEWEKQIALWGYSREREKIDIQCIQTVYKWIGKHFNTVVIDECHWSLQGKQFSNFLKNNTFDRILCLTATPPEDSEILTFMNSIAPIIHITDINRALKLGLVSPVLTYNIPVKFTEEEQDKYNNINSSFSFYETQLGGRFVAFDQSSKYLRFRGIGKNGENIRIYIPDNKIIYKSEINGITINQQDCRDLTSHELLEFKEKVFASKMYWKAMRERKVLFFSAENKIKLVKEICDRFSNRKTIIFSETIESANKITKTLGSKCITFHSKMSDKDKIISLQNFKDGTNDYISSVKALNEGMDVPDCSLGICHSGTSKIRSSTQRSGRISRYIEGKIALYFNLYMENTQELSWIKSRTKNIEVKWILSLNEILI